MYLHFNTLQSFLQSKLIIFFCYQKQQGMNLQITYYMKVAIDINKKVGGTRAYQAEANNRDKFIVIREQINKSFHYIRAKIDEREKKKGQDVSSINAEIRQKLYEINNQLQRMREAVASEKAANPAAQSIKYDLIEKLTNQARELQELIDASSDIENKMVNRSKNNQTYTEMREQLLEGGKPKNNNRIISKQGKVDEATEMQLTKIKQWQKVDEQIDREIEQLIKGLKTWKQSILITGELIKQSDDKIIQLTQDVDKVNQDLFKSNKQLKGIVQKMRKPHKFCIDIILILILIALIIAIVKISGG